LRGLKLYASRKLFVWWLAFDREAPDVFVIIIVTGLSLAFGDMGDGLRRLIQIVFSLSIAFASTFAGGALIN